MNKTTELISITLMMFFIFALPVSATLVDSDIRISEPGYYELNKSLNSIDIRSDNVIFNGNGHELQQMQIQYMQNNITIKNIIFNNSETTGLFIKFGNYITITNNTFRNSGQSGVYIGCPNNINISGNKFISNEVGVSFYRNSRCFAFNNIVYNNYFNNTINFRQQTANQIFTEFNIVPVSGTNIIGGGIVGGNYWANSYNTDYSQICVDADIDGICDLPYEVIPAYTVYPEHPAQYDYYPLTYKAQKTDMQGDVNGNGVLDTGDATIILRYLVELPILDEELSRIIIGDINCNNFLDTGDATLILRSVVNMPISVCWK